MLSNVLFLPFNDGLGRSRIRKGKAKEKPDANPKRSKKVGMKKGKKQEDFNPAQHIQGILEQGNESYKASGLHKRLLDFGKKFHKYF